MSVKADIRKISRAFQRVGKRWDWWRLFLTTAGFAAIFFNVELSGNVWLVILGIVLLCDAVEGGRR